MPETLLYLTYMIVILLIGLLCTVISKKSRWPSILLLILVGIALNNLTYRGKPVVELSPLFLTSIGIIALVMIVFDSTARFKFKEFDTFSVNAIKLMTIFLFLNLFLLSISSLIIMGFPFTLHYILLSLIFAALMAGTDTGAVITVLKGAKNKITDFLEVESILNTPLTVVIPFLLLDFIVSTSKGTAAIRFTEVVFPFLTQIVAGIGAGVLMGLVAFKVMRRYYSEDLSPLAIIVSAMLAYILAENLGGNGVLAVTAMGLIFGSIYVKQKMQLMEFSSVFSTSMEIFVFVLIGLIITIPYELDFFIKSFVLFAIHILIRLLAVHISFMREHSLKEKIFMSLTVPKGISISVVAFTLTTYSFDGMSQMLNYILVFILYSIILASLTVRFSGFFMQTRAMPKEKPIPASK